MSAKQETTGHASDCAVHNAPALPVGPCTCGAAGVCPYCDAENVEPFHNGARWVCDECDPDRCGDDD